MDSVNKLVRNYFERNAKFSLPENFIQSDDIVEHIISIGTSILCTKWGIGYPGGSFVQAVVNNDLMRAVSYADNINAYALKFYCQLMYNVGKPDTL